MLSHKTSSLIWEYNLWKEEVSCVCTIRLDLSFALRVLLRSLCANGWSDVDTCLLGSRLRKLIHFTLATKQLLPYNVFQSSVAAARIWTSRAEVFLYSRNHWGPAAMQTSHMHISQHTCLLACEVCAFPAMRCLQYTQLGLQLARFLRSNRWFGSLTLSENQMALRYLVLDISWRQQKLLSVPGEKTQFLLCLLL